MINSFHLIEMTRYMEDGKLSEYSVNANLWAERFKLGTIMVDPFYHIDRVLYRPVHLPYRVGMASYCFNYYGRIIQHEVRDVSLMEAVDTILYLDWKEECKDYTKYEQIREQIYQARQEALGHRGYKSTTGSNNPESLLEGNRS